METNLPKRSSMGTMGCGMAEGDAYEGGVPEGRAKGEQSGQFISTSDARSSVMERVGVRAYTGTHHASTAGAPTSILIPIHSIAPV
jgi:hypothetical protein